MQRQSTERPNAVWLTKDPTVETLAQLKGKAIAVPSLTGIITDALIYLLKREGVERDEVKLVQTPFPTMGDQLQAGHVDAAIATIPFYTAIASTRIHEPTTTSSWRPSGCQRRNRRHRNNIRVDLSRESSPESTPRR